MDFRTLYQGEAAGEPGVWLLRTLEIWQWYWTSAHQNHSPVPGAPGLNPGEMVVLVALGLRGSGGFGVNIHRLVEENGVLHVFATETRPGPDSVVTAAETFPAHAVAIADRSLGLRLTLEIVED
jgi:hypothetical protein